MTEPGNEETEVNRATAVPTDEELAARAAEGSRTAFEELVSRYSPRLFHFLRSRSGAGEDVEDLVQETFLKAYRNIGRYDPSRRFSTWLYTIAFRLAISRHRSQGARPLAARSGRTGTPVARSPGSSDPEGRGPASREHLAPRQDPKTERV